MLFSKNLNVLTLAIASSRADVVSSLLAPADEASSSYLKKKRERRRDLLLAEMEQRMDMTKAEIPEDEAGVDPTTGADVGDLNFRDGDVEEEIEEEDRMLRPDEGTSCRKCIGTKACFRQPDEDVIGCQSCKGDKACALGPFGPARGVSYIGELSCNGDTACYFASGASIGNKSCSDRNACERVGGSIIKDMSCGAFAACRRLQGYVGEKSCNGKLACTFAGFQPGSRESVIIGSNSCNGYFACASLRVGTYIAPNTCNKPCECCYGNGCADKPKCRNSSP